MGQIKGAGDKFKPVKGLVTEANEGNFPQEAAYDLRNVEVDKTGRTLRRLGLDAEEGAGSVIAGFTEGQKSTGTYSTYLWKALTQEGDVDIRIIQTGNLVTFLFDTIPLGGQTALLQLNLTEAPFTLRRDIESPCQYAYGAGFVIITNADCEPFVVKDVGPETVSLEASVLNLEIRARKLLSPYDTGPNYGETLSYEELFNLRNSGWPWQATVAENEEGTSVTKNKDPLVHFFDKLGYYPTHSMLYHSLKLGAAKEPFAIGAFSPWEAAKINFGKTTPPLGRYIHSAYSFNAPALLDGDPDIVTTASSPVRDLISGAPLASSELGWNIYDRPSCCGFLNGHAIYGDIDQNRKARILVSQIAKDVESLARCHQDADPTADEINDLIATDGIVLNPVGMGRPIAMRETSKGLIIFCSNGAWVLRGTAGAFSAIDFELVKIDEFKFNSPQSVQVVGDAVFFATESGIQVIAPNDFGELKVSDLTEQTIKSLYIAFGEDRINRMIACYVKEENYVYWLVPEKNTGDAYYILILNLELGGFFIYEIESDGNRPALHLPMAGTSTTRVLADVQVTDDSGVGVTEEDGVTPVTSEELVVTRDKEQLVLLASYSPAGSLVNFAASFNDLSFWDWSSLDGYAHDYAENCYIEFAYDYPQSIPNYSRVQCRMPSIATSVPLRARFASGLLQGRYCHVEGRGNRANSHFHQPTL